MNKNVERGQATRSHLISVATRLFAERGYDATSIETVLTESGVSRGSLYHHFPRQGRAVPGGAGGRGRPGQHRDSGVIGDARDPVGMLRAGCLTWIRQAREPVVRQVMLIDAPAVLGWQRWRELDESALAVIKESVAHAAGAGAIDPRFAEVFAHVVLAAVNEVAMMIAMAGEPADRAGGERRRRRGFPGPAARRTAGPGVTGAPVVIRPHMGTGPPRKWPPAEYRPFLISRVRHWTLQLAGGDR